MKEMQQYVSLLFRTRFHFTKLYKYRFARAQLYANALQVINKERRERERHGSGFQLTTLEKGEKSSVLLISF